MLLTIQNERNVTAESHRITSCHHAASYRPPLTGQSQYIASTSHTTKVSYEMEIMLLAGRLSRGL